MATLLIDRAKSRGHTTESWKTLTEHCQRKKLWYHNFFRASNRSKHRVPSFKSNQMEKCTENHPVLSSILPYCKLRGSRVESSSRNCHLWQTHQLREVSKTTTTKTKREREFFSEETLLRLYLSWYYSLLLLGLMESIPLCVCDKNPLL